MSVETIRNTNKWRAPHSESSEQIQIETIRKQFETKQGKTRKKSVKLEFYGFT